MAYKKMTAEEKRAYAAEKAASAKALLEKGLRNLRDSYEYKNFLDMLSSFHNYSANNVVMIAMQKPDATHVASFTAWKKMGRFVKKGEKGLKIWAPNINKVRNEETGEDEQVLTGYRIENVFDISQTDGAPLPELKVSELRKEIDNAEAIVSRLVEKSGVSLTELTSDDETVYGTAVPDMDIVSVRTDLATSHYIKTLVHEIAHVKLHKGIKKADRKVREAQAESVAYIVCKNMGIDTGEYSFGYITAWMAGAEDSEISKVLNTIVKTASEIIEWMD